MSLRALSTLSQPIDWCTCIESLDGSISTVTVSGNEFASYRTLSIYSSADAGGIPASIRSFNSRAENPHFLIEAGSAERGGPSSSILGGSFDKIQRPASAVALMLSATRLLRYQRSPVSVRKCSFIVENTGSTARDHLASERTLLAWSRTGLGFFGAGLGLFTTYCFAYVDASSGPQTLSTAVHPKKVAPASLLLIGNGVGILGFACRRYFKNMEALQQGKFIISKNGLLGVVGCTALSTVAAVGMVVQQEWSHFEEKISGGCDDSTSAKSELGQKLKKSSQ